MAWSHRDARRASPCSSVHVRIIQPGAHYCARVDSTASYSEVNREVRAVFFLLLLMDMLQDLKGRNQVGRRGCTLAAPLATHTASYSEVNREVRAVSLFFFMMDVLMLCWCAQQEGVHPQGARAWQRRWLQTRAGGGRCCAGRVRGVLCRRGCTLAALLGANAGGRRALLCWACGGCCAGGDAPLQRRCSETRA